MTHNDNDNNNDNDNGRVYLSSGSGKLHQGRPQVNKDVSSSLSLGVGPSINVETTNAVAPAPALALAPSSSLSHSQLHSDKFLYREKARSPSNTPSPNRTPSPRIIANDGSADARADNIINNNAGTPSRTSFDSFTSARRPLSRSTSPSRSYGGAREDAAVNQAEDGPSANGLMSSTAAARGHSPPSSVISVGDTLPHTAPIIAGPSSQRFVGGERSSLKVSDYGSARDDSAPRSAGFDGGSGTSAGSRGMKRRPLPLDLSKGKGIGMDPELRVHKDEVASAISALSARSNGESGGSRLAGRTDLEDARSNLTARSEEGAGD